MKKYLYIYKTEIMSNLQYIFDIFSGFIGYLVMMFIFLNLWQYIYSDPNELINGYTMNQMIWYVVFAEILYMSIHGSALCKRICKDVKSGNIAYNMNKPYSYIGYILSSHLGLTTIKAVVYALLGLLTGFLFLHSFPSLGIVDILFVIVSSILGTIINILIIIMIGLISFFIEDAQPIYWIYGKLLIIAGTIFPIEYFPTSVQGILKFSPIYVTSYGPSKLFVDASNCSGIEIIVAQIIYLIICFILCSLIYKKGVKNLNVNGG